MARDTDTLLDLHRWLTSEAGALALGADRPAVRHYERLGTELIASMGETVRTVAEVGTWLDAHRSGSADAERRAALLFCQRVRMWLASRGHAVEARS